MQNIENTSKSDLTHEKGQFMSNRQDRSAALSASRARTGKVSGFMAIDDMAANYTVENSHDEDGRGEEIHTHSKLNVV